MGRKKVLIAFAVILCLIVNTLPVFAATSLHRDPYITIVSPTQDAVMKNGKVLVSVKMTAPRTIKMSLYKESNSSHTLIKSEKYSSSKIVELLYPSADRPYSRGVLHQYFDAEFCGKSDLCQRNLR